FRARQPWGRTRQRRPSDVPHRHRRRLPRRSASPYLSPSSSPSCVGRGTAARRVAVILQNSHSRCRSFPHHWLSRIRPSCSLRTYTSRKRNIRKFHVDESNIKRNKTASKTVAINHHATSWTIHATSLASNTQADRPNCLPMNRNVSHDMTKTVAYPAQRKI